jgi:hypothetical protein
MCDSVSQIIIQSLEPLLMHLLKLELPLIRFLGCIFSVQQGNIDVC